MGAGRYISSARFCPRRSATPPSDVNSVLPELADMTPFAHMPSRYAPLPGLAFPARFSPAAALPAPMPTHRAAAPPAARRPGRVCQQCGTGSTAQWRYGNNGSFLMCNACGIRWRRKHTGASKRPGPGAPIRKQRRSPPARYPAYRSLAAPTPSPRTHALARGVPHHIMRPPPAATPPPAAEPKKVSSPLSIRSLLNAEPAPRPPPRGAPRVAYTLPSPFACAAPVHAPGYSR